MANQYSDRVVAFFYRQAGYSWRPGVETARQGRLRGAKELARAERWLDEQKSKGAHVDWEVDDGADRSGIEHDGALWGCIVSLPCELPNCTDGPGYRCRHRKNESLWGIDLGANCEAQEYRRVVEAELALELMEGRGGTIYTEGVAS